MSTTTADAGPDEELEALYATHSAAQRAIVQATLRRLAAFFAGTLPDARQVHLDTDEGGFFVRAVTCQNGERLNALDDLPEGLLDPAWSLIQNLDGCPRLWGRFCDERNDRHGTYTLDLAQCADAVIPPEDCEQLYTVVGAWAEPEAEGQVEEDEDEPTPEAWVEVVRAPNADKASSLAIELQRRANKAIVGRRSERDGYGCEPYPIAVFEGGMKPVRQ